MTMAEPISSLKKKQDFFGDKLAKNNPDKFHANVTEKRQQLDDGKIVGVNAAEAFYLLRNQKQQNLLVSEDGIMHWKDLKNAELNYQNVEELSHRIMTIEVENSYSEKLKALGDPVEDENIDRIEQLPNGSFKIIYKKEHVAMTGIEAIFIDKDGRYCGDPYADREEPQKRTNNSSGKKQPDSAKSKIKSEEIENRAAALIALAKAKENAISSNVESDEIVEMIETIKSEVGIEADVTASSDVVNEVDAVEEELVMPEFSFGTPDQDADEICTDETGRGETIISDSADTIDASEDHRASEEVLADMQVALSDNFAVESGDNILDDDFDDLTDQPLSLDEIVIPDFGFDDNALVVSQGNPITESESPEDICVVEESEPLRLEYHSIEQFSSDLLEANENYILEAVFANPVAGQVCVDYKEQIVYLEKGYVAKAIRTCVLDHFKGAYDDDHAPSNTTGLYDRKSVEMMLYGFLTKTGRFERIGNNDSKRLFKMLLGSEDVDNLCFLGWYFKIKFENVPDLEELIGKAKGASVSVIASTLTEIIKRSERLKPILKEFF